MCVDLQVLYVPFFTVQVVALAKNAALLGEPQVRLVAKFAKGPRVDGCRKRGGFVKVDENYLPARTASPKSFWRKKQPPEIEVFFPKASPMLGFSFSC